MNKTLFWLLVLLSFCGFIYLASDVIAPFVIAFLFAYMLHPAVESYCYNFNVNKGRAVFYIFILFISLLVTLVTLILPNIYNQISLFIAKIPYYRENFDQAITFVSSKINKIDPDIAQQIAANMKDMLNNLFSIFSSFFNHAWQYALATINFFTICVLVPFILYYFLRDWPQMVKSMESLLPLEKQDKTREIIVSINKLLSAYIRGQLSICLILIVFYIIGLHLIGIDFALPLGVCCGLLVLIPLIGSIISYVLIVVSCYISFGFGIEIGYATILFIIAHILEGYFLTPKIIGNNIGLHPVWIIFAILLSANLFGVVGIFFALPVAGILKIFWLNAIEYYKNSVLYKN